LAQQSLQNRVPIDAVLAMVIYAWPALADPITRAMLTLIG
jgi:hypothetical protein